MNYQPQLVIARLLNYQRYVFQVTHYLQGFEHLKWLFGISEPSKICFPNVLTFQPNFRSSHPRHALATEQAQCRGARASAACRGAAQGHVASGVGDSWPNESVRMPSSWWWRASIQGGVYHQTVVHFHEGVVFQKSDAFFCHFLLAGGGATATRCWRGRSMKSPVKQLNLGIRWLVSGFLLRPGPLTIWPSGWEINGVMSRHHGGIII